MLRSKHVTIMHRMEHHMFQTILEQISFKSSLATNHSHNCFRKNQTLPSKLIYPLRNDGWKIKKNPFQNGPFQGGQSEFCGRARSLNTSRPPEFSRRHTGKRDGSGRTGLPGPEDFQHRHRENGRFFWLVVEPTHLKNMSQTGDHFPK